MPFVIGGVGLICVGVISLVGKKAYQKSAGWNMFVEALNLNRNAQEALRIIGSILPILIGLYFLLNGALYPGKVLWLMQLREHMGTAPCVSDTSLLVDLNKAAASAKEAVPAMAALDFETRIDDEFNKLISQELRILDYDNSIRDLLISDSLEGEWEGDERRRLTIPFDAERRLNEAFGK